MEPAFKQRETCADRVVLTKVDTRRLSDKVEVQGGGGGGGVYNG